MGLSRSAKIWILLTIDVIFFFIELFVGYAVGSLALVADSFHMLNDVMSLVVALYAIKLSANSSDAKYSYGWHRAEILAALINGVFLLFLCLSIFLEAIERFFSVPEISNPNLVVIVGCWGLASNIFGLALFHEHGHGHGHSHDHDSEHGSSDHGSAKTPGYTALPANDTTPLLSGRTIEPESPKIGTRRAESVSIHRRRSESFTNEPVLAHPAQVRASLVQVAEDLRVSSPEPGKTGPMSPHHKHSRSQSINSRMGKLNVSHPTESGDLAHRPSMHLHDVHEEDYERAERGRNFGARNDEAVCSDDEDAPSHSGVHAGHSHSHSAPQHGGHSHSGGHSHGGHSHGNMNMRALVLHVLGDALGNVGVIATGLIIGHTNWDYKYYCDPIISLVITVIIFVNAMPLVKSASFILLQGVPPNVDLEDVREAIVALPGVLSVHELHIWQLSETKNVASVHVLVRRAAIKSPSDASSTTAGDEGKNKMVMRNNKDGTVIRDLPESDELLYMSVAADIRRVLHEFGIHSSTIQPEYCMDGSDDDEASARSVCLLSCPADMDCEANKCCSTTVEHT